VPGPGSHIVSELVERGSSDAAAAPHQCQEAAPVPPEP
jgi:hypothetical protein